MLRALLVKVFSPKSVSFRFFSNLNRASKLLKTKFDIIIDIGANNGQFAFMARKIFANQKIISFEPQKKSVENYIKRKICNTLVVNAAVSQRGKKMVDYFESFDSAQSSFLKPRTNIAVKKIKVNIVNINSILKKIKSKKIFLKLDTQGYDFEILRNIKDFTSIKIILCEISFIKNYKNQTNDSKIFIFLAKKGFSLYRIIHISYAKNQTGILEMDCLFLKND